jgi:hypothetical protein
VAGDRAIEFLNSNPQGQPFCLSISFNASHAEDWDLENHFPWPKAVDGMYEADPEYREILAAMSKRCDELKEKMK